MSVSDLERSAIQVLAAETGATDVKAYPEPYYCVLASDDYDIRVHIHHSYPQWVMARVGRGSSTKKKLDPESVRAALLRARKIDETLARAATLIREDGRFTLVDGSPQQLHLAEQVERLRRRSSQGAGRLPQVEFGGLR